MELTDPTKVYLLYDTGHAYYGGADPLMLLRKHYDRIAYIHLKDIRQAVLDEARAEKVDFVTCIRKGVFTVPGDGCIDFEPIFAELLSRGYNGWAMLEGEQDPAVHPAYEYAKKALNHIESLILQERR
jgi:inosose dehydratase